MIAGHTISCRNIIGNPIAVNRLDPERTIVIEFPHAADPTGIRHFYDDLAATYDLYYADWDASAGCQARALQQILKALPSGEHPRRLLDCACGIGTQLLGLAALGEHIIGTDFSPAAVHRAHHEAHRRKLRPPLAVADMRALPFADHSFDGLVCADNSLPHLTTPVDLAHGLGEMARVLRAEGMLLISVRDYDTARRQRPNSTPPSVRDTPAGRVITFQVWHWYDDGERYNLEHFQLLPTGPNTWQIHRRNAIYWAVTRAQLDQALHAAGFYRVQWHESDETGFFQPIVTARLAGGAIQSLHPGPSRP
ncbi:MAG TPA: class I SAM-dependent methyltransferase [Streptosporangiaceae bacterium]